MLFSITHNGLNVFIISYYYLCATVLLVLIKNINRQLKLNIFGEKVTATEIPVDTGESKPTVRIRSQKGVTNPICPPPPPGCLLVYRLPLKYHKYR